jgi:predicted outer membrane protein
MRLTIVFAFALAITAQDQRYSSKPGVAEGKSTGKPTDATRIRNAIEFTPDGVFLHRAALDNAFVIEFGMWARTRGDSADVRNTASELILVETRFGDDLRKLAGKKHVVLPEKLNERSAGDRANLLHATDTDRSFVEQLLQRYDREIVSYQREALAGSDPDIKSFALDGVETLQEHRRLVEALQEKLK